MYFAFTREQIQFRDELRKLLIRECPPAHVRAAWASESGRSGVLWAKMAAVGLLGIAVPESLGGAGEDELALILPLEECGRVALPEPIVDTVAVAAPLLRECGSAGFARRWLPALASGAARIAVAFESSPFVADAHVADLLIYQREDTLYAIDPSRVPIEARASVDRARRLFRVDVPSDLLTDETLLARGDAARGAIDRAFDRGAVGVSAELLGIAQRMIEMSSEHAKTRHQFGKPIGSFEAVKHPLASALVKIEFARPAVHRAAHSIACEERSRSKIAPPGPFARDVSVHVSMAKSLASDAALFTARVALQCHGAIGYSFEHDLHLWLKRAWALAASWGDAAWHRARIADAIFEGANHQPGESIHA